MVIQIKVIDHIVLLVCDVKRSVAFYCDVLGCIWDREQTDLGLYHLRAGSVFIDLVDIKGKIGIERSVAGLQGGTNMDHFALKIEPFNEAEIRQHLQGYGIKAEEVVERYGADGVKGNSVELKGPAY
jgi:catechol 2,3-dioxygenase-like lactoylglutathione lyase family enzyme